MYGALPLMCITAHAAGSVPNYPNKPIHYIVPFAQGDPTDIMSRAIGEKIGAAWGQQVVVDNRSGAGGNIGAEIVAKSAPDGYTVMIGHVGTHAINVSLYPKVNFDPVRDFTPISAPTARLIDSDQDSRVATGAQ
jgi:tripartite-type tricarboxylate transporter receptor subunit TctC